MRRGKQYSNTVQHFIRKLHSKLKAEVHNPPLCKRVPPQRTRKTQRVPPTCWTDISSWSSSLSVQGSSEARQTRLHQMRRVLHGQIQGLQIWKKQTKKKNKQSAISKFPKFHLHFQISRQKLITNVGFIGQLLSVHSVHSPPRLDFGCISSTQHAVPGPWSQWDICEHWENATKRLEKCVKTCDVSCFQRLEFHGITTSIL